MAYMQQCNFQQMWRRDVHGMTRKSLLSSFCIWTSYLSHSDCLVVILQLYKPENIFKQTRVSFFTAKIWRPISITFQVR